MCCFNYKSIDLASFDARIAITPICSCSNVSPRDSLGSVGGSMGGSVVGSLGRWVGLCVGRLASQPAS